MCVAYAVNMHLYAKSCEKFSCLNLPLLVFWLPRGCFWLSPISKTCRRVLFPVHGHNVFSLTK
jgi:hypothetical protein